MERAQRKSVLSIGLLGLLHLVGAVSLQWNGWPAWQALVLALTPLNLLLALGLVLLSHPDWNRKTVLVMALIAVAGWFIEVLGVHTGVIFGQYSYGPTLGPALLGVPLAMAVNWLLLVWASAAVMEQLATSLWLKVLGSATLMVALDFLIEPVAMRLDFWDWAGHEVPWMNYLAWFVISLAFHFFLQKSGVFRKNPVAVAAMVLQFLFFLSFIL